MIAFLLNIFLPLIIFSCAASRLLYRYGRIDLLNRIALQAFAITLPAAAFLSLVLLGESFWPFALRAANACVFLLAYLLIRRVLVYLPQFIRKPLHYLYALVDDFFVFLSYFVLYRSACRRSTAREGLGSGGVPILMIHGYKHDAGAWHFHRPYLVREGHGPIFVMDLGGPLQSIEEYAHDVKEQADKIFEMTGTRDLILVGFSMGGVVAAYYAVHLAPKESLKGVMTVGSPLEGTKMAIFAEGACAEQMRYRTPFITALKEGIAANESIPFCHIGSFSDPTIRPVSSAWTIEGRSQIITLEGLGHLSLLYSEVVSKTMSSCLHSWKE